MADTRVVVVGCGGHGREIAALVSAMPGTEFLGFVDDAPPADWDASAGAILGHSMSVAKHGATHAVVGVGSPEVREKLVAGLDFGDLEFLRAVHPSAQIGPRVSLGPGCVIGPGSVVTADARLHGHVHLHANCVVSHDCNLDQYTTLAPRVAIAGDVTIESGAFIGVGAAVNRGITIGTRAVVGAGAVVVADVERFTTVVGVPAKPMQLRSQ